MKACILYPSCLWDVKTMQQLLLWMQQHLVITVLGTVTAVALCVGAIALPLTLGPSEPAMESVPPTTTTTATPESLIAASRTTTTTTTTTTTKSTTRRTVKPPPIVMETDDIKDTSVEREEIVRPDPNTINVNYVKENFGGQGHLIGIDVSRHNGDIDWEKVKSSGVDFAIIRCGGRGYGTGAIYADTNFYQNIEGAIKAGIPVGIYFFSAAINEYEALEEAAYVIEVIKNYKEHITWPVAFDFEVFDTDRLIGISDTTITDNAIAFMDTIAAEGYTPMLYCDRNKMWNRFETARLSRYRLWMAQYVNTLDQKRFNGEHAIWQCASDGKIDGIKGRVDMNIAYSDLSKATGPLPERLPSSYPTHFDGFSFTAVCEEVEVNVNGLNARLTPYTTYPNKWATLPRGTKLLRTGIDESKGWSRLEINGVTVYVSSQYVTMLRKTETTTTATTTTTTTTTQPSSTNESSASSSSTSATTG